jgi:hypothetical protein
MASPASMGCYTAAMADIDVFNGDADGICALTQLRNAEPRPSTLITGVKRDIALVMRANVSAGDRLTALDISFDKNRDGVLRALDAGPRSSTSTITSRARSPRTRGSPRSSTPTRTSARVFWSTAI